MFDQLNLQKWRTIRGSYLIKFAISAPGEKVTKIIDLMALVTPKSGIVAGIQLLIALEKVVVSSFGFPYDIMLLGSERC